MIANMMKIMKYTSMALVQVEIHRDGTSQPNKTRAYNACLKEDCLVPRIMVWRHQYMYAGVC